MKRGEVWTAAGGGAYTGKPRPVVVVQDDRFDMTASVTVCPFTTDDRDALLLRIPIQPSAANGLAQPCRLMVDKLTTVPKANLRRRIGALDHVQMARLGQAMAIFLGLPSLDA